MKAIAIPGVIAAALVGVGLAILGDADDTAALLIAPGALYATTAALFSTGPKRTVALRPIKYEDGREVAVGERLGEPIPANDATGRLLVANQDYKSQRGLFFMGLVLGKDGRWSTSKTQVLLWTYAVLFGLTSLILATAFGDDAGWEAQKSLGLQDEYLILLGGPFAAAVIARGITGQKVENGTIQKTSTPQQAESPLQGLGEVVSDDEGQTDLADTQYFLFNLLALAYFLGTFIFNIEDGFPEIPDLLVGLTSVSAAGYVGKKAAERAVPIVTSVLPKRQQRGKDVEIWGRNLIVHGGPEPGPQLPHIFIADKKVTEVTVISNDRNGSDHLRVTVPMDADSGDTHLQLVTAAGIAPVDPQPFAVLA